MDAERQIESRVITNLCKLLDGTGRFKKVVKGEAIKGKGIGEILGWHGMDAPWVTVTPDLILAFDNYRRVPDDVFLLAIETKYFPKDAAHSKKHWRQSFREIGQSLRDLLYGFDAVVLWHLFSEETSDGNVLPYAEMCDEVITKLKLPMIYFATQITRENKFKFFKPWAWGNSLPLSDVNYLAECLIHINLDQSYGAKLNPLLQDEKAIRMRRAIKSVLRIPH